MPFTENRKSFTRLLALCSAGLLLNLLLSNIVKLLGLPIFLDNAGTILIAALGGALPGIFIGFLTNALNSIADPISLYYGVLSICIAFFAAVFSKYGFFKKLHTALFAAVFFAFIGGCLGSCLTWALYGGGIGEGISSPFARSLFDDGIPAFWAQLTADTIIDLIDKIISVVPIFFLLKNYPKALYGKFPLSLIYEKNDLRQRDSMPWTSHYRTKSINTRIITLIIASTALVGILSIAISSMYYQKKLQDQYAEKVMGAAKLAAGYVDASKIDVFIKDGRKAKGYLETERNLYRIYNSISALTFVYVYRMTKEGNYVVFDLDVPTDTGDPAGMLIPSDSTLSKSRADFLTGKDFTEPLLSYDTYGWMYSGCSAIRDMYGKTQAYACVDITLSQYRHDVLTYVIRIIALLFGALLLIMAYATWYAKRSFIRPLNGIVKQSQDFDSMSPELWLSSDAWKNRMQVQTGDEIEELYNTLCNVERNISNNVAQMKETERKLRESQEIERKNRELSLAVKRAEAASAAKTMFLSNVSHDMRTPLNSVIGFTDLAKKTASAKDKDKYLQKISQAADYLLGLINDTLDLSRMETGKMKLTSQSIAGKDIVADVLNCNDSAAKAKNISIKTQTEPLEKAILLTDKMRLEEIFNNIVGNAIKFTPEGGEINFKAEQLSENAHSTKLSFEISDTGIGMSEEFLPHVFEPFTQEKPYENKNYTGSGLGLSIVKKIVDLMDGTIAVKSTMGKGTTFTIVLDIQKAKDATIASNTTPNDFGILAGEHILMCEDHPMNVELAKQLLEMQGMKVTVAWNGKEGVDAFEKSKENEFSAILMDIRMPIMNGIEAAQNIRALQREDAKKIPIIALTADAFEEDTQRCFDAGMNAYASKPIDPQKLFGILVKAKKGLL